MSLLLNPVSLLIAASVFRNEDYPILSKVCLGLAIGKLARKFLSPRRKPGIAGRRCVVTGVGSGIGFATAKKLAEEGWRVYGVDINAKGLESLRGCVGPNLSTHELDLTNENSCKELTALVARDGGALDALVCIAGVSQPGATMGFDEKAMRFVFEVNTFAPMRLTRLMYPLLLKNQGGGTVCMVTSSGDTLEFLWSGYYSPSKFAVRSFLNCVRREAIANNLPLRVCSVAPGAVLTPLMANYPSTLLKFAADRPDNPFVPACKKFAEMCIKMRDAGWVFFFAFLGLRRYSLTH